VAAPHSATHSHGELRRTTEHYGALQRLTVNHGQPQTSRVSNIPS
jgi:hypothetical protein